MSVSKQALLYIGYCLVAFSVFLYPCHLSIANLSVCMFSMAIGALLLAIFRIIVPLECYDANRTRRFRLQQLIGTLALFFAAYFMYFNDRRWILAVLTAALIDIIIAFRIPQDQ